MKITKIPKNSVLIIRTKNPVPNRLAEEISAKLGTALNIPVWLLTSEDTEVEVLTTDESAVDVDTK